MKYTVEIPLGGCWKTTIEADNEDEAQEKAVEIFNDLGEELATYVETPDGVYVREEN